MLTAESDSVLWILGVNELYKYNPQNNQSTIYSVPVSENASQLIGTGLFSHYIFIGSDNGVVIFDNQLNQFIPGIKGNPVNQWGLKNRQTNVFNIDQYGNLFVNDGFESVSFTNLNKLKFKHLFDKSFSQSKSSDSFIRSIEEDDSCNIWIGTMNSGIIVLDSSGNFKRHFKKEFRFPDNINNNTITKLARDSGGIWCVNGTLNYYDYHKGYFKNIDLRLSPVLNVIKNSSGNYFVSALSDRLYEMKFADEKYQLKSINIPTFRKPVYNNIYEDTEGKVWLSEETHVDVIKKNSNNQYQLVKRLDNILVVKDYKPIDNTRMWMCSKDGLYLINIKTYTFKKFTTNEGLADNYIYSILKDNKGYYWISSNRGLSKFNFNVLENITLSPIGKLTIGLIISSLDILTK